MIDYGSGNLRSAAKAFERAARENALSAVIRVTAEAEEIRRADAVVLPGVGAFADCYRGLAAIPGMMQALEEAVIGGGRPFLGICVGMQLMAERGQEFASHLGLGWIGGEVVKIVPGDPTLKVPHMGWNELQVAEPAHPVLAGLTGGNHHGYFVHSFQFRCRDPGHCLATVDYGGPIAAVVGRDNLIGTQFHPEKSQSAGLRLIDNFLRWRP